MILKLVRGTIVDILKSIFRIAMPSETTTKELLFWLYTISFTLENEDVSTIPSFVPVVPFPATMVTVGLADFVILRIYFLP